MSEMAACDDGVQGDAQLKAAMVQTVRDVGIILEWVTDIKDRLDQQEEILEKVVSRIDAFPASISELQTEFNELSSKVTSDDTVSCDAQLKAGIFRTIKDVGINLEWIMEIRDRQDEILEKTEARMSNCPESITELRTELQQVKEEVANIKNIKNLIPVNGHWSVWATWSSCTVSCGQGKKVRHRQCDNPAPANDGKDCRGNNMETATCKSAECPIAGNWGEWSPWMPCSQTCGNGEKTRTRLCNNPSPQFGGDDCNGDDIESTTCNPSPCPIHGGWSEWTEWGQCSETCGEGLAERSRTCDSPLAQHGGRQCTGKDSDRQPCNLKPCAPPPFTLPPLEDVDITAAGELFVLHKDWKTVSLYHPDAAAGFRLQWTRPAPAVTAGWPWGWIYAAGDGRALLHADWRETVLLEADWTEAGRWRVEDLYLRAASSRWAVYREYDSGFDDYLHVYAVTDHSTRLFSLTPRDGGRWGSYPRVDISPAGTILVEDRYKKLLAAFSSAGERLYQVPTTYTPFNSYRPVSSDDQHVFVLDYDRRDVVHVHEAAGGDHVTTLHYGDQLQDGEKIYDVWAGQGQTLYFRTNKDGVYRIITQIVIL